jgi:hypothetical protein
VILVYLALVINILIFVGNLSTMFSSEDAARMATGMLGTFVTVINILVCCIAAGWL